MIALFMPRRMRAGFVMLLLMIGSLLLAFPAPGIAQDQTLEWSRPIPLSGALGGSRYPSLVANDNGQLLLIWSVTSGEGITIFSSRFDGSVWLRPVDVLLGGPETRAVLDGRNRVHLMYSRDENQILTQAKFVSADTAQGWGDDLTINSAPGGTSADFVLTDDDSLYTIWLQKLSTCDTCFSVGFKRYGKDVLPELTYRVLADLVNSPQQRSQLRRAADGTLYVLWDETSRQNQHAGISLSLSTDNGETWLNEPRTFFSPDADIRQPLLFVDKLNNLVLVYNFGVRDETYFSVSTDQGQTWTEPAPIPGLFTNNFADASDYFAHVTDSSGIAHLIASGRALPRQQTPGLYHLTWDGNNWSKPQELYGESSVPEFPSVTLANGNQLHVTFATRDTSPVSGSVLSSYRVWYTTALTNAPAATRVPLPTFTSTPTATATPEPTSTATPRPSPTPLPLDEQTASPASNNSSLGSILIVIVPVALILIGVVVWARVFRRRS